MQQPVFPFDTVVICCVPDPSPRCWMLLSAAVRSWTLLGAPRRSAMKLFLLNKKYILYIILLLREGTSASRSRLGNLLTLSQNSALA